MNRRADPRVVRRKFVRGLVAGLRVVWPVLSGLLAAIAAMGVAVGLIENWSVEDAIYFAFVSGLTIGYGELVPSTLVTRALAIGIGICGGLLTALLAAIAVKALSAANVDMNGDDDHRRGSVTKRRRPTP